MAPSPIVRYVVLVLGLIITIHYILSFSHEEYGRRTSLSNFLPNNPPYKSDAGKYYLPGDDDAATNGTSRRKANAAFVILARNSDLQGVLESVKQVEDRFNKKFGYPYVFLNEEDFSDDFKKWTSEVTSTPTSYGKIPHDHWYQPDWIDEDKATKSRLDMIEHKVIYGHSVPYRNMCRYNSGFFYKHELLKDLDYYWRVEPNIKLFCDIDYDPFLLMQDKKKVYGFTLSLYEYIETIPTLWDAVKDFMKENPDTMPKDNALSFVSDDGGQSYNKCHFWSNFEIGDLNFWRGEAYNKFFDFLDKKGGFYYERWGDAPVHSIGAALFAHKDQIHFFEDIGYRHEPFQHCPQGKSHAKGKCWCSASENFDYEWYSCLSRYDKLF